MLRQTNALSFRGFSARQLIAAAAYGAFVLVALVPIAAYFIQFLPDAFNQSFPPDERSRLASLLGRTVFIALLTASLSVAAALVVFFAIESHRSRRLSILYLLASIPFFIPAHFEAVAWIQTTGRVGWLTQSLAPVLPSETVFPAILYSSFGCAFVLSLHLFPIALAAAWLGWRTTPREPVEAAAAFMRPNRLWLRASAHWLRPWMSIAWLAVFILALLDYSVPSLLRRHVFPVEIMTAYSVYYDPAQALVLSLPLLAISLAAASLLGCLLSKQPAPAFVAESVFVPPMDSRARWGLSVLASLFAIAGVGVPLLTFIRMAGGWESYETILISARGQILSTLAWSALTALLAVLFAAALTARTTFILPPLAIVLFALPGSIAGMAHVEFWSRPALGAWGRAFYDSGAMLPAGLFALTLPVAFLLFRARRRQTPRTLIELERVQSHRSLRRAWLLFAPRFAATAIVAAAVVFVLAVQEVHASILLVAPGQETLSIRAYTLLHYAPDSLVAAFCLVSLASMLLGVGAILALFYLVRLAVRRAAPYCAVS